MELLFKKLKKTATTILRVVLAVASIVLLFSIIVWVFAPSYKFPAKKGFEGQEWYNPYLGLDSAKWYAASLHIMPKGGNIFKGSNYEVENKILSFYRSKSITYPSISDKHSIKIADATDKLNFNSYEHGFNLLGQNRLIIGGADMKFFDYPIYLSTGQSQSMIHKNRPIAEIVVLSGITKYSVSAFSKLTDYDLLEISDNSESVIKRWDIALSAGRAAFMLAAKRENPIKDQSSIMNAVTMIPVAPRDFQLIYGALRDGMSYGLYRNQSRSLDQFVIDSLPRLTSLILKGDTASIVFSKSMGKIEIYTDGGVNSLSVANTSTVDYKIPSEASYVRFYAQDLEGNEYLLNPIVRSIDGKKPVIIGADINKSMMLLKRVIFLVLLAAGYLYLKKSNFIARFKTK